MRSVQLSALTVLALGALVPSAFAAQTFSFANPYAAGGSSYINSMFETVGVPTQPSPASLQNIYNTPSKLVNLVVTGGSTAGTYSAYYTLTNANGSVFNLQQAPSTAYTILDGGTLTFFSAQNNNALLTYTFAPQSGILTTGGFGVESGVTVSGSLVDASLGQLDQSKSNFSFSFPGSFIGGANTRRYTADFTSSVQAVPEPASMGVLAIGAVAMLRRRRKA